MVLEISDQIVMSDRFVWNDDPNGNIDISHFGIENSIYRCIPFFLQPQAYSDENRRTIECFKNYIIQQVGYKRFCQVCNAVDVDLEEMQEKGVSLTSRTVAKIFISSKQVSRAAMLDAIEAVKDSAIWTRQLPPELRRKILIVDTPEDLDSQTFHELYCFLESPFKESLEFKEGVDTFMESFLAQIVYVLARFVFDKYLFIKKRTELAATNPHQNQIAFYERMGMNFAGHEEMEVGTLLRAPNSADGSAQYYRLAAKLITANGQFSMLFIPASQATELLPIRVTRGTSFSLSGIDVLSYFITDFEEEIGLQGFESGEPYESYIDELLEIDKWVEIGYSSGGAIAQWRTAHHLDKVHSLWSFRSTGVPERVNETFNQNANAANRPFDIHVIRARGDFVDYAGDSHLGKDAPQNVDVHFNRLFLPGIAHLTPGIGGSGRIGIEGGYTSEEINYRLNNRERSSLESFRKFFGGYIIAPIFKGIRSILRYVFGSRAELQKGLWVEDRSTTHWTERGIVFTESDDVPEPISID